MNPGAHSAQLEGDLLPIPQPWVSLLEPRLVAVPNGELSPTWDLVSLWGPSEVLGRNPSHPHPTRTPLSFSEPPSSLRQRKKFLPRPGGWIMDLQPSLRTSAWTLEELKPNDGDGVHQGQFPAPWPQFNSPPTPTPSQAAPAATVVANAVARSNVLLARSRVQGREPTAPSAGTGGRGPSGTPRGGLGLESSLSLGSSLVCGHRQANLHLSPLGGVPTLLS